MRFLAALLAAATLAVSAPPLMGQGAPISGTAQITLTVTPPSVPVGSPVQVGLKIDVTGVTGIAPGGGSTPAVLGGYQVRVAFDRLLLSFTGAVGGSSTGYTAAPTFTSPAIANANGAVILTASQTSDTAPTGLVDVAVLSFTAIAGGTSALTPTSQSLSSAFQPGPPPVGPASIPGSGTPNSVTITGGSHPIPSLASLSPPSATEGGAGFDLTVTGSNFIASSEVRWNGSPRPTTFLSGSQLTAAISAADIATAGTAAVTVFNPPPGGGTSNAINFTIASGGGNPVPVIFSLSPPSATEGGPGFTLTITGSSFIASSDVRWNGSSRPTTFLSGSQLTAAISAADIATAGTAAVTVFNPPPGGGTSNAINFTIASGGGNPVPVIFSLSPPSATAGEPGFSLAVNGSSFIASSVVRWNGADRPTTFISDTAMTAVISAADLASPGSASVTVFTPAPGGGTSNALTFTISTVGPSLPAILSLSPGSAVAGGTDFALTVQGSNFVSGSTVQWDGSNRSTTFASTSQLAAAISSADIAAPGSRLVTVTNPGVGTSAPFAFFVENPMAPLTANFSHNPGAPTAGQAVQFVDASTGGPTSWSWTFGDPGSGSANSSSSQSPQHAFASPGSYNVTLLVSNGTASSSLSLAVTVTAAGFSSLSTSLPVAGHVTGQDGIVFMTDVQIENPNPQAISAALHFFPVGGGASTQIALNLAPMETRSLPDVVAAQFGVTNSFGALRLDVSGTPAPTLRMTSRTWDQVGAGTFGMAISGIRNPLLSADSRYVTGLHRNAGIRSNLGAVNSSAGVENFVVVLRAPDGSILGTSPTVTLPPGGQWQNGLKDLFPDVFGTGMTAEFRSVGGSMVPVAYAALADNLSGDLTYYPSSKAASLFYLPVLSRVTGVGGSLFKSELSVSNISDVSTAVTFTFFERDRDNTTGVRLASISLAPRETRLIDDALAALLGLTETFGALKVESTGPMIVAERIYTASPTSAGTVGQQVDPVPADAFYSRGSILGLRQDAAFRANLGFFNPNLAAALVNLSLRRGNGEVLATGSVSLLPRGFTQANLANLFPGVPLPSGELLTVAFDATGAQIAAYGIIADNVSQDLTASPGLP